MRKAILDEIDLIAADLPASAAFYRRLGVEIAALEEGAFHAPGRLGNAVRMHLHTEAWARVWNEGWRAPNRVVIGFHMETREEVDAVYEDMTAAGYAGLQPPYDAFWGARYAVIEDPSGIAVGLMSPADPAKQTSPPLAS